MAQPEDSTDRHVARWRGHWVLETAPYDDTVEAITTRIGAIMRHLREHKKRAATEAGLQDFEYDTLHALMIRDTPGTSSPTALAADLGISPAGMSGRLEGMEKAGFIQRTTDATDRRRLGVEATPAGIEIWREVMARRGQEEDEMLGVLSAHERETLSTLLKRVTLHIEGERNR
ncbi:MarR family winged helix-turn-helix transcriptional regulator [Knoellia subterranea]|uniref:MarR family transcriptional regulator n=1 Tax=Knoellia subterranea KCTC 19937 TaxID=1385521 RepID=A0A0A0JLC5_9MICO|nr:MarR family transcriptional regulator [Knoellia subterranea]KGN37923.1 MarR family transcriptional regulator [Knoellia subterranea KCTC 19937]